MTDPQGRCKAQEEDPQDAWDEAHSVPQAEPDGRAAPSSKLVVPSLFLPRSRRTGNKIWLETHIWHSKRMHMVELWGHRLVRPSSTGIVTHRDQAEKPTAKAFRASYRASVHGALLHDASYHQYLELKGTEEHLRLLLDRVSDPAMPSPGSKRHVPA